MCYASEHLIKRDTCMKTLWLRFTLNVLFFVKTTLIIIVIII